MLHKFAIVGLIIAPVLVQAGGGSGGGGGNGGGGGGVPVPKVGPPELRVSSPTIPAGGTAQLQYAFTDPRPIMTGTGGFDFSAFFDGIFGVAVFSPGGDAYGVAGYANGKVNLSMYSPLATLGSSLDYPLLTITTHIRPDLPAGSSVLVAPNFSIIDPTGAPMTFSPVAGKVTVGGSMFINNVVPGGGTWPTGTRLRVLGGGFTKGTALTHATFRVQSWGVISASEVDLILGETVQMDGQRVDLQNPDKSTVSYYSYLRGVEAAKSAEPLVANSDQMFPLVTHARVATQQYSTGIAGSVLTALALQNPNAFPVAIKLEAKTPATGTIAETTITLGSGEKTVRELGEFFGQRLPIGAAVEVTSVAPFQSVGFTADRATGQLAAFVPAPF